MAISAATGVPASTVHAILVRNRINRVWHIDRRNGEPIRRYEHDHPGAMIHVDVKKLGNIPNGGGWRYVGDNKAVVTARRLPAKPAAPDTNP